MRANTSSNQQCRQIFFRIVPQHHVDDEGVADEPGQADQRVEDLDDGHDPGGQTGRARGATPHQALQLQLCNNRKYIYEDEKTFEMPIK